jgi:divalent metal cation (Fe/Co/Zn/Cd) transporter
MITAALATRDRAHLLRRGLRLEYLTVGWNLVEGLIAIGAGLAAGSVALIGFGIDSFVESGSGSVLIWRLRAEATGGADEERVELVERRAERLVGLSFLVLGAYVGYVALQTLVARDEPAASPVGIALTILSLALMLWLARAKRRTGEALASRALIADSQQTFACWYLSATTLAGLALNAVFGLWWADPVAALVIVLFLVRGRRGVAGRGRLIDRALRNGQPTSRRRPADAAVR